jgi:hypothetical protein
LGGSMWQAPGFEKYKLEKGRNKVHIILCTGTMEAPRSLVA